MPSQNDIKNSAPSTPAPSATPTTPTVSAPSAATATTSNASPSGQLKKIDAVLAQANRKAPGVKFTAQECVLLVLTPMGTIHPVVNKPGGPVGVRVFDDAEEAMAEHSSNPRISALPFAVVGLKDLF